MGKIKIKVMRKISLKANVKVYVKVKVKGKVEKLTEYRGGMLICSTGIVLQNT